MVGKTNNILQRKYCVYIQSLISPCLNVKINRYFLLYSVVVVITMNVSGYLETSIPFVSSKVTIKQSISQSRVFFEMNKK